MSPNQITCLSHLKIIIFQNSIGIKNSRWSRPILNLLNLVVHLIINTSKYNNGTILNGNKRFQTKIKTTQHQSSKQPFYSVNFEILIREKNKSE